MRLQCHIWPRVVLTSWGKCSRPPKSTFMSQEWAICSRLFLDVAVAVGFSPCLTNCIVVVLLCGWYFLHLCFSRVLASSMSTLSWHHLYLRWVIGSSHPDGICAMVSFYPQSLHSGSSLMPHLCKFVEVGSVIH